MRPGIVGGAPAQNRGQAGGDCLAAAPNCDKIPPAVTAPRVRG
jgi:hypothetical protein